MLQNHQDIRRAWVRRQQQKYHRGLITSEELAQALTKLQQVEEARPGRVQDLAPPQGPKSVRIPMDRMTELAIEYLLALDPAELDLDYKLEKAELFRAAVCRWAIRADWEPPEELLR